MTIKEQLQAYEPYNEQEKAIKPIIVDFLEKHEDAFLRENLLAHMTASAWIVNKERTKVLMAYHNIYKSWGWLGGHADGDEDLLRVCRKEVAEESGLTNLKQIGQGIYGINLLHVAPHYKNGKYVNAHLHMDIVYLFEADERETVRMKADENSGVAWIPIKEIPERVTEEHMKPVYAVLNEKLPGSRSHGR